MDQYVRPVAPIGRSAQFYCAAREFNDVLRWLWADMLVPEQLDPPWAPSGSDSS